MKQLYPVIGLLAVVFLFMAAGMISSFVIAKFMDARAIDRGWMLIPFTVFFLLSAICIGALTAPK